MTTVKTFDIINPTDLSELQSVHQFVRDFDEDVQNRGDWKIRMARRYYDRLYKEYAIFDVSRYKEGLFGMRWRTEDEVISGKGQSQCGGKGCQVSTDLRSYEMPFRYSENGSANKCELVKVRACRSCLKKLSHSSKKEPPSAAASSSKRKSSASELDDEEAVDSRRKRREATS